MNLTPFKSQPFNIFHNGVYILDILFNRICVVKPQITYAVIFFSRTKINTYCLCMSNMKISVWFWRKTCLYSIINAVFQIFVYSFMYKINRSIFHYPSPIIFWVFIPLIIYFNVKMLR